MAIGGQYYHPLGLLVPFIMVALIVMSFTKGRYWCGNYCPHGSVFDFLLLPLSRNKKIPALFTSKITIVLFFLFFMTRLTSRFIMVFQNIGSISVYDRVGMIFSSTYLMVLIAGGLLAVLISPRTWCHICPMGKALRIDHKKKKLLFVANGIGITPFAAEPKICWSTVTTTASRVK